MHQAHVDAIRTGLTAAGGVGAALALLLAVRRQRSTELTLELQERTVEDARHDTAERRITELYIKAVEQLGADQAPVRLGGIHALARLAQENPAQRQTIVDLMCAYLRMPYPTIEIDGDVVDDVQEGEVRLATQRVLTSHLRPERDEHGEPANPGYWPGIDLDLRGATLVDLDLHACHLRKATFTGARFVGDAWFVDTTFDEDVWFDATTFDASRFAQGVSFDLGRIDGNTISIGHGRFFGARFDGVRFHGRAVFVDAEFDFVTFTDALFADLAWFSGAAFIRQGGFEKARFGGGVDFDRARFNEIRLEGARASVDTPAHRKWPEGWRLEAPDLDSEGEPDVWGAVSRSSES